MEPKFKDYLPETKNLIASCIGTLTAEMLTLPICTTKTIYQNNKKLSVKQAIDLIYQSNGIKGFFVASTPAIISQTLSTSTKFTIYQVIKKKRQTYNADIFNNSLNGMISGLVGSFITHPFDAWKNFRQRNESYSLHLNNQTTFKNLVAKGFYPGFSGTIGKNISLYATLFPLNDFYKSKFDSVYISAPLTTLTISLFVQPFDYYKVVKMAGTIPTHPFRGFWLMLGRNIPHFTITMGITELISKNMIRL